MPEPKRQPPDPPPSPKMQEGGHTTNAEDPNAANVVNRRRSQSTPTRVTGVVAEEGDREDRETTTHHKREDVEGDGHDVIMVDGTSMDGRNLGHHDEEHMRAGRDVGFTQLLHVSVMRSAL